MRMKPREVKKRLAAALALMCPECKSAICDLDNTIKDHIELLELLAKYMPFDKEAACRESFELGKKLGGRK